jgi:alkylated DNA repair dioxygenase AlkB
MDERLYELHLKAGLICGQEKTCGSKRAYDEEAQAQRAADAHNRWAERRRDVEPYPCAFCRKWHIGGVMPPETMEAIIAGLGPPVIPMSAPDLLLELEFVSSPGELYEHLVSDVPWDERMRARKTANCGVAYNYSGMTYATLPMHPRLVPILDRLEQKLGHRPNNCLLNYYPDGDSTMGFHSDSEEEIVLGTGVAIVSLGAERAITFRSKQDRQVEYRYALPSGSLL